MPDSGRGFESLAVPSRAVSPLTAYVVETLVTLLGVVALAVLVLYAARRFGVGRPGGPIALVGRLPLDGRRAVYLVRVGRTVYVLGASEAGIAKLGEHPEDSLALDAETSLPPFSEVLQRALGRPRPPRGAAGEPPGDPEPPSSREGGRSEASDG